jgi:hypothetical protein
MAWLFGYVNPQSGDQCFYKTLEEALASARRSLDFTGCDDGTPILRCALPKTMTRHVALAMLTGRVEEWAARVETVAHFAADPRDHILHLEHQVAEVESGFAEAKARSGVSKWQIRVWMSRLTRARTYLLRAQGMHWKEAAEAAKKSVLNENPG